uniref:Reverse transcriptase domain-containing protein n=1 Tax=Schistocephalus solidus TaxID=70667 RepID=A0A183TCD3_SCHSO
LNLIISRHENCSPILSAHTLLGRRIIVGRRQVVCIGQERSSSAVVESGVPQGSVLGPILFLIYVNDCVRNLDCEAAMFADDIKIWNVIQSPADEDKLQINLTRLKRRGNPKDLGVLMTTTLKPSSHCSKVAKRAISVLHAIRRAFLDFDEDLFAKTFGICYARLETLDSSRSELPRKSPEESHQNG